jgi:putative tricarboxylic transport membrane protein
VPTLAFGVPGSATMAILLGAFLIHGLVPGPDMLHKNLDITYAMVWSIALANILGAGACYAFSPQFARLATLRYTLILPAVLSIVYIGAFEASRSWGDLIALLLFGVFGWLMKQFKWPRPPLVLGLVLGDSIERYMFISIERYGFDWLWRPVVIVLLTLALIGVVRPFLADVRRHGGIARMLTDFQAPKFHPSQLFTMFFIVMIGAMVVASLPWAFAAKLVPMIVGIVALVVAGISLFNEMCRKPEPEAGSLAEQAQAEVEQKIHMDLESDTAHLPLRTIVTRSARFYGYLVAFMASMALIGLIPTAAIFVVVFMRLEGPEKWKLIIPYVLVLLGGIYIAFDQFMAIPWPPTVLGWLVPAAKIIPSVQ